MLVLSRFPGQRIIVGDSIVITIVDIRNGERVRVGIDAPDDVRIDRLEVAVAIEEEKRWLAGQDVIPPRPLAGGLEPHPLRRDARRPNGEGPR